MSNQDAMIHKMNEWGKKKEPFLFIIDFEIREPIFIPLHSPEMQDVYYEIHGLGKALPSEDHQKEFHLIKHPVPYQEYFESFQFVQKNLKYGNSYLVNLTFPTKIETSYSLNEIFSSSKAKYKLLYKDKFVVFSPEIFVQINEDGIISSFPMKGTIDAALPDAGEMILSDRKEFAEHCTIVDLIRNDLSMVAKDVYVEKFRYIDRIITHEKELLQVSSCIKGRLEKDFYNRIGDILFALLPAGSVSGAPKKKTMDIILEAENYKRGFYTGVFGIFDGNKVDSAVMIRYIEKKDNMLYYKSGGGITVLSDPEKEYQELIDKVYVPLV